MAKKIITGAEAPTEQITQQFPDVPAPVAPEKVSVAEGCERVAEYLAEVNADVAAGRDPKNNLDHLKLELMERGTFGGTSARICRYADYRHVQRVHQ